MRIVYGIIELIAKDHLEKGNKDRYHLAILRMWHIRAIAMYGYDHPTTVHYRTLMHQRWRELA